MAGPIPGFNLLPTAAVEKWHAQEDIDDTPFKRPLRAMMAHHNAVDRVEELVRQIQVQEASLRLDAYSLIVALTLVLVGSVSGYFVDPYFGVIALAGCIALPIYARSVWVAWKEKKTLVEEMTEKKREIAKQYALAKQLVADADSKIVDLGPPPDEV